MISLEYFDNPSSVLAKHTTDVRTAGADAFGRGEDFFLDVDDHFLGSEWGHLIVEDEAVVGFALCSTLPENGAHLEGIAIRKEYQSKGLGLRALSECVKVNNLSYVTATTRNPATMKVMSAVGSYSTPDMRLDNPFEHIDRPRIREALLHASRHLHLSDAHKATMPFLEGKYPPALYGVDPGASSSLEFISQNPTNAFLVASIVEPDR